MGRVIEGVYRNGNLGGWGIGFAMENLWMHLSKNLKHTQIVYVYCKRTVCVCVFVTWVTQGISYVYIYMYIV